MMIKLGKPPKLNGQFQEVKRDEIKRYFLETWETYESLFSLISDQQGFYQRAESLRHPLIFYFGHTAVFFVNKLVLGKYVSKRVNESIESTCAVGVDEMSWDDLNPNNYTWPSVDEVKDYRNQVKALVLSTIEEMPLKLPITQDSLAWVILMGIEHERIHLETSSVIMRMLDLKYLKADSRWQACTQMSADFPVNKFISFPKVSVKLGKPVTNDTYGWDNEYGEINVDLEAFDSSQMLVSNGEFMAFVESGGYQQEQWWTDEGRGWLAYTKARMPRFWEHKNNEFFQRNLTAIVPLPLNWPVEVNYLEAKAFCNWKSHQLEQHIRLPVEAEWQSIRDTLDTDLGDWENAPGNINLEYYSSSCPVNRHKQGEMFDIIGNVWQWTESPIDGYPGFKVHPLYDDFSTPTFDGKHNLIKGGSWISTGNEATRDSRYAFRRHFSQHAGFRYVRSSHPEVPLIPVNEYETQTEVSQLLYHHFPGKSVLEHIEFETLVKLAEKYTPHKKRALDMGCGGGRLSFSLANSFEHVTGIDFTARHIQHCLQLKETGVIRFATPQLGELLDFHEVALSNYGYSGANVEFFQGDGHNLKPQFNHYDLIVCHDVLEHSYNPKLLLESMIERLTDGGILVLGSAYQWSQHDDQRAWLGGYKNNGENVDTRDNIAELFQSSIQLIDEQDVTRSWFENARSKRLLSMAVTVWRKI